MGHFHLGNVKVSHLTQIGRSQFYALVREALSQLGDRWPVVAQFPKSGGYGGTVEETIQSATEAEFEADLELSDWTRFLVRIQAAALRDAGRLGSYLINHNDGSLEIRPS